MSRFGRDNASKRLEQLYRVLNSPLNIRTIKSSSVSSSEDLQYCLVRPIISIDSIFSEEYGHEEYSPKSV